MADPITIEDPSLIIGAPTDAPQRRAGVYPARYDISITVQQQQMELERMKRIEELHKEREKMRQEAVEAGERYRTSAIRLPEEISIGDKGAVKERIVITGREKAVGIKSEAGIVTPVEPEVISRIRIGKLVTKEGRVFERPSTEIYEESLVTMGPAFKAVRKEKPSLGAEIIKDELEKEQKFVEREVKRSAELKVQLEADIEQAKILAQNRAEADYARQQAAISASSTGTTSGLEKPKSTEAEADAYQKVSNEVFKDWQSLAPAKRGSWESYSTKYVPAELMRVKYDDGSGVKQTGIAMINGQPISADKAETYARTVLNLQVSNQTVGKSEAELAKAIMTQSIPHRFAIENEIIKSTEQYKPIAEQISKSRTMPEIEKALPPDAVNMEQWSYLRNQLMDSTRIDPVTKNALAEEMKSYLIIPIARQDIDEIKGRAEALAVSADYKQRFKDVGWPTPAPRGTKEMAAYDDFTKNLNAEKERLTREANNLERKVDMLVESLDPSERDQMQRDAASLRAAAANPLAVAEDSKSLLRGLLSSQFLRSQQRYASESRYTEPDANQATKNAVNFATAKSIIDMAANKDLRKDIPNLATKENGVALNKALDNIRSLPGATATDITSLEQWKTTIRQQYAGLMASEAAQAPPVALTPSPAAKPLETFQATLALAPGLISRIAISPLIPILPTMEKVAEGIVGAARPILGRPVGEPFFKLPGITEPIIRLPTEPMIRGLGLPAAPPPVAFPLTVIPAISLVAPLVGGGVSTKGIDALMVAMAPPRVTPMPVAAPLAAPPARPFEITGLGLPYRVPVEIPAAIAVPARPVITIPDFVKDRPQYIQRYGDFAALITQKPTGGLDTSAADLALQQKKIADAVASDRSLGIKTQANIALDIQHLAMRAHQKAVGEYIDYNYLHRFDVRTAPDPVAVALGKKIDDLRIVYLAAEKLHNEKMADVTPDFAKLLRADTKQMRDYNITDKNYLDILRASDITSKRLEQIVAPEPSKPIEVPDHIKGRPEFVRKYGEYTSLITVKQDGRFDTRAADIALQQKKITDEVSVSTSLQNRTRANISLDILKQVVQDHARAVKDYEGYRYEHRLDVRKTPDPQAVALGNRIEQTRKAFLAAETIHNNLMAEVTPDFAKQLRSPTKQAKEYGITIDNARTVLNEAGSDQAKSYLARIDAVPTRLAAPTVITPAPAAPTIEKLLGVVGMPAVGARSLAEILGLPTFGAAAWTPEAIPSGIPDKMIAAPTAPTVKTITSTPLKLPVLPDLPDIKIGGIDVSKLPAELIPSVLSALDALRPSPKLEIVDFGKMKDTIQTQISEVNTYLENYNRDPQSTMKKYGTSYIGDHVSKIKNTIDNMGLSLTDHAGIDASLDQMRNVQKGITEAIRTESKYENALATYTKAEIAETKRHHDQAALYVKQEMYQYDRLGPTDFGKDVISTVKADEFKELRLASNPLAYVNDLNVSKEFRDAAKTLQTLAESKDAPQWFKAQVGQHILTSLIGKMQPIGGLGEDAARAQQTLSSSREFTIDGQKVTTDLGYTTVGKLGGWDNIMYKPTAEDKATADKWLKAMDIPTTAKVSDDIRTKIDAVKNTYQSAFNTAYEIGRTIATGNIEKVATPGWREWKEPDEKDYVARVENFVLQKFSELPYGVGGLYLRNVADYTNMYQTDFKGNTTNPVYKAMFATETSGIDFRKAIDDYNYYMKTLALKGHAIEKPDGSFEISEEKATPIERATAIYNMNQISDKQAVYNEKDAKLRIISEQESKRPEYTAPLDPMAWMGEAYKKWGKGDYIGAIGMGIGSGGVGLLNTPSYVSTYITKPLAGAADILGKPSAEIAAAGFKKSAEPKMFSLEGPTGLGMMAVGGLGSVIAATGKLPEMMTGIVGLGLQAAGVMAGTVAIGHGGELPWTALYGISKVPEEQYTAVKERPLETIATFTIAPSLMDIGMEGVARAIPARLGIFERILVDTKTGKPILDADGNPKRTYSYGVAGSVFKFVDKKDVYVPDEMGVSHGIVKSVKTPMGGRYITSGDTQIPVKVERGEIRIDISREAVVGDKGIKLGTAPDGSISGLSEVNRATLNVYADPITGTVHVRGIDAFAPEGTKASLKISEPIRFDWLHFEKTRGDILGRPADRSDLISIEFTGERELIKPGKDQIIRDHATMKAGEFEIPIYVENGRAKFDISADKTAQRLVSAIDPATGTLVNIKTDVSAGEIRNRADLNSLLGKYDVRISQAKDGTYDIDVSGKSIKNLTGQDWTPAILANIRSGAMTPTMFERITGFKYTGTETVPIFEMTGLPVKEAKFGGGVAIDWGKLLQKPLELMRPTTREEAVELKMTRWKVLADSPLSARLLEGEVEGKPFMQKVRELLGDVESKDVIPVEKPTRNMKFNDGAGDILKNIETRRKGEIDAIRQIFEIERNMLTAKPEYISGSKAERKAMTDDLGKVMEVVRDDINKDWAARKEVFTKIIDDVRTKTDVTAKTFGEGLTPDAERDLYDVGVMRTDRGAAAYRAAKYAVTDFIADKRSIEGLKARSPFVAGEAGFAVFGRPIELGRGPLASLTQSMDIALTSPAVGKLPTASRAVSGLVLGREGLGDIGTSITRGIERTVGVMGEVTTPTGRAALERAIGEIPQTLRIGSKMGSITAQPRAPYIDIIKHDLSSIPIIGKPIGDKLYDASFEKLPAGEKSLIQKINEWREMNQRVGKALIKLEDIGDKESLLAVLKVNKMIQNIDIPLRPKYAFNPALVQNIGLDKLSPETSRTVATDIIRLMRESKAILYGKAAELLYDNAGLAERGTKDADLMFRDENAMVKFGRDAADLLSNAYGEPGRFKTGELRVDGTSVIDTKEVTEGKPNVVFDLHYGAYDLSIPQAGLSYFKRVKTGMFKDWLSRENQLFDKLPPDPTSLLEVDGILVEGLPSLMRRKAEIITEIQWNPEIRKYEYLPIKTVSGKETRIAKDMWDFINKMDYVKTQYLEAMKQASARGDKISEKFYKGRADEFVTLKREILIPQTEELRIVRPEREFNNVMQPLFKAGEIGITIDMFAEDPLGGFTTTSYPKTRINNIVADYGVEVQKKLPDYLEFKSKLDQMGLGLTKATEVSMLMKPVGMTSDMGVAKASVEFARALRKSPYAQASKGVDLTKVLNIPRESVPAVERVLAAQKHAIFGGTVDFAEFGAAGIPYLTIASILRSRTGLVEPSGRMPVMDVIPEGKPELRTQTVNIGGTDVKVTSVGSVKDSVKDWTETTRREIARAKVISPEDVWITEVAFKIGELIPDIPVIPKYVWSPLISENLSELVSRKGYTPAQVETLGRMIVDAINTHGGMPQGMSVTKVFGDYRKTADNDVEFKHIKTLKDFVSEFKDDGAIGKTFPGLFTVKEGSQAILASDTGMPVFDAHVLGARPGFAEIKADLAETGTVAVDLPTFGADMAVKTAISTLKGEPTSITDFIKMSGGDVGSITLRTLPMNALAKLEAITRVTEIKSPEVDPVSGKIKINPATGKPVMKGTGTYAIAIRERSAKDAYDVVESLKTISGSARDLAAYHQGKNVQLQLKYANDAAKLDTMITQLLQNKKIGSLYAIHAGIVAKETPSAFKPKPITAREQIEMFERAKEISGTPELGWFSTVSDKMAEMLAPIAGPSLAEKTYPVIPRRAREMTYEIGRGSSKMMDIMTEATAQAGLAAIMGKPARIEPLVSYSELVSRSRAAGKEPITRNQFDRVVDFIEKDGGMVGYTKDMDFYTTKENVNVVASKLAEILGPEYKASGHLVETEVIDPATGKPKIDPFTGKKVTAHVVDVHAFPSQYKQTGSPDPYAKVVQPWSPLTEEFTVKLVRSPKGLISEHVTTGEQRKLLSIAGTPGELFPSEYRVKDVFRSVVHAIIMQERLPKQIDGEINPLKKRELMKHLTAANNFVDAILTNPKMRQMYEVGAVAYVDDLGLARIRDQATADPNLAKSQITQIAGKLNINLPNGIIPVIETRDGRLVIDTTRPVVYGKTTITDARNKRFGPVEVDGFGIVRVSGSSDIHSKLLKATGVSLDISKSKLGALVREGNNLKLLIERVEREPMYKTAEELYGPSKIPKMYVRAAEYTVHGPYPPTIRYPSTYPLSKVYPKAYPKPEEYPKYPTYPEYTTYPKYPKPEVYPKAYPKPEEYAKYPTYPKYPGYPGYPTYPKYPEYLTYPKYPGYPEYPTYPDYPKIPKYPDIVIPKTFLIKPQEEILKEAKVRPISYREIIHPVWEPFQAMPFRTGIKPVAGKVIIGPARWMGARSKEIFRKENYMLEADVGFKIPKGTKIVGLDGEKMATGIFKGFGMHTGTRTAKKKAKK